MKTIYRFLAIRLPRTVMALMAGTALAVGGAALQRALRNPLASPDLLGITGAASLVVVPVFTLPEWNSAGIVPLAIAGALAAGLILFLLFRKIGLTGRGIIWGGMGATIALGAASYFLLVGKSQELTRLLVVRRGYGWVPAIWTEIDALWPWIAVVALVAWALAFRSESSLSRRIGLALCAIVLAGAIAGFVGMLSFIGLLAPRIANKLTGHDPRFSFSISGLLGGLLVLLADIAGRT